MSDRTRKTQSAIVPEVEGAITRRHLLIGSGALAGSLLFAPRVLRADDAYSLDVATVEALRTSPLVYVSPLSKKGVESRCHGEVWFFLDRGGVVIFTATDGWKARAIAKGRKRARLWVGNFGPVRSAGDRYRAAPTFEARAEIETRADVFDRLMSSFAVRYADEWKKWRPRFQKGHDDGSRVMIRYTPIGA
jgi:hypothetical protein